MDRLQRLFRLAQKTGDTLIIHDASGHDMVMMDVDRYEMFVADAMYGYESEPLHDMNEREMLDKINRDIAIWRSHQEEEDKQLRSEVLADKLRDEPPFDPFEEDLSHKADWFTAGDVLQSRHESLFKKDEPDDYHDSTIDFDLYDDTDDDTDDDTYDDLVWEEGVDDMPEEEFVSSPVAAAEMHYDEIGEDQFAVPEPTKRDVPFKPYEEIEIRDSVLDDEEEENSGPVFFEEPV